MTDTIYIHGLKFKLRKGKYENGRLALMMFNEKDVLSGQLTVNIPDAMFQSEDTSYCAFINHIDFVDYGCIIDTLEYNNMTECVVAHAHSGFNHYIGVEFNHEFIDNLEVYEA